MARRLTSCGASSGFGSPSRPGKVAAAISASFSGAPSGRLEGSLTRQMNSMNPRNRSRSFSLAGVDGGKNQLDTLTSVAQEIIELLSGAFELDRSSGCEEALLDELPLRRI